MGKSGHGCGAGTGSSDRRLAGAPHRTRRCGPITADRGAQGSGRLAAARQRIGARDSKTYVVRTFRSASLAGLKACTTSRNSLQPLDDPRNRVRPRRFVAARAEVAIEQDVAAHPEHAVAWAMTV